MLCTTNSYCTDLGHCLVFPIGAEVLPIVTMFAFGDAMNATVNNLG